MTDRRDQRFGSQRSFAFPLSQQATCGKARVLILDSGGRCTRLSLLRSPITARRSRLSEECSGPLQTLNLREYQMHARSMMTVDHAPRTARRHKYKGHISAGVLPQFRESMIVFLRLPRVRTRQHFRQPIELHAGLCKTC